MENIFIILVLAGIVGGVLYFLRREKKKGVTCIGCPHAKQCGGSCGAGEDSRHTQK